MADAPERIWANGLGVYGETDHGGTEYIRADLATTDAQVMAHPKVKALVGALVSVRADAQIMLAVCKIERTVNAALRELDGING